MNRFADTLRRTLFLDILLDRRSRPVYLYAIFIVALGAALSIGWKAGSDWTPSTSWSSP